MTSIFPTRSSTARAASAVRAVLLTAALMLCFAASASAHGGQESGNPVGGTKTHAYADGVIGMSSTVRRWKQADRRRRAAQRKRNRALKRRGVKLLTDQQIRQGVLLQSLGIPIQMSAASITGVASESGNIPLSRTGQVLTGPTGYALTSGRGAPSADTVTPGERAVKGEWSTPVQPNYPTFGPNQSPQTGFPNPNYPTGTFPGDPIIDTAADYSANPGNTGLVNARYWSPNPRIIPIFEAMLPNGKVLYWDWYFSGNMNDPDQAVGGKKGTRVLLWDPANPTAPGIRKDVPGENLFCAGFAQLPNGDLFLAGGNANATLEGLNTTFVYHWRTGTWDQSQNMSRIRWYPSVAATWNGEQMIVGGDPADENGGFNQGGNAVPEIFTSNFTNPSTTQNWDPANPADKIRVLGNLNFPFDDQNNPHVPGWRLYPFLFPWVDGRVLYGGRETDVLTVDQRKHGLAERDGNTNSVYDPAGDSTETDDGGDRYVAQRADGQDDGGRQIVRTYGTGAQYGRGKVLVTAGDEDRGYALNVPLANRGPGWGTYNADVDNPIDSPNPGANWVCLGYANGNPYTYSGNPFAANTNFQWSGNAALVHVWNTAWCAGTNTVNSKPWVNGASKEAALITMKETEGTIFGQPTSKGWPTSTQTQSMHYPRRMANLTVLPTGKLIATGGLGTTNAADEDVLASEGYPDTPGIANNTKTQYAMNGSDANVNGQLVNYNRAIFASEMWDPDTGTWTVMDSAHRPRQYHSTTILLPDARLMSGGGGVCSTCTTSLYSEANFEYYSPPYLFWPDGDTKVPDERPQITGTNGAGLITEGVGANAAQVLSPVEYDASFTVNFQAGKNEARNADVGVQKAALVKLGEPTHGFDQGQLYVPLEISDITGSSASLKAPPNPFEAPPGYYWLFLMDANGTPSVAKAIQVGASLPLQNKLRAARAYAESDLEDPYPSDLSSSQDFGLGSYRATQGNLADVRDNSMSSIKIDAGFYAKICRGDDLTGCATVPAGNYKQLGTAFQDHVSSLEIKQGTAPQDDTALLTNAAADNTGPVIALSAPLEGPGGYFDTTGTSVAVAYSVTDNVSEKDSPGDTISCNQPSGHVFSLNPGTNTIDIVCLDGAGNSSTATVHVRRTGETGLPPVITISSPLDGSSGPEANVIFSYTVEDDSGLVPGCSVASGTSVSLNFGSNTIGVTCEDGSNHSSYASTTRTRTDVDAPTVTITSPLPNAVITTPTTPVTYTVSDNSGQAPTCTPATSGASYALPVVGANTITVTCTDASGNIGAKSIQVMRKAEGGLPPVVTITSPADNATTTAGSLTLAYTVEDDSGLPVTCDRPNGSVVPLAFGANVITVTCTDQASHSNPQSRTVTRTDDQPPVVAITSPADNATVTASPVTVAFSATDNAPGAPSCSHASGFQQPLTVGVNVITVSCQDASGNASAASVHVAYIPSGTKPADNAKFVAVVKKRMKFSRNLSFKALCVERCQLTIGVVGKRVSYWPKAKTLKASKSPRVVTFRLKSSDYKLISGALKRKTKLKLGLWINDVRQGSAKLTR